MMLERVNMRVETRITSLDWDWVDTGVGVAGFWDTDEGEGMGEGYTLSGGSDMSGSGCKDLQVCVQEHAKSKCWL